ncbi:MAG: DUF1513 domain-containing protein [Alphaproteobacteria bacterium]|nr:DUF1513 domain-containing protein [Alphaproteobacteria bacterium]
MPSMGTEMTAGVTRREVLAGLGASLMPLAGVLPVGAAQAGSGLPFFLSARSDRTGRHFASAFSLGGKPLADVSVPARGHGAAAHAGRDELVLFARRPGRYALVLSRRETPPSRLIAARPDRRFAGHGFYAPDGRYLYAVEDDVETAAGVMGIYDTRRDFVRIGEIATGGIGPHQALLLADGKTVAVCNGGIRTHPDFPRTKLNLATMSPSLALIDRATGRLLAGVRLPGHLHQLSIRHLDAAPDGTLAIGLQYEGPKGDPVPLVVVYRDGALVPFDMRDEARLPLRGYVGSIAFDTTARVVAATSPVGGVVGFWAADDGRYLGRRDIPDVCGLAAAQDSGAFIVTAGEGGIYRVDAGAGHAGPIDSELARASHWDNHLLRVIAG